jgi:uncharacterized membrane protein (DUF373 family)
MNSGVSDVVFCQLRMSVSHLGVDRYAHRFTALTARHLGVGLSPFQPPGQDLRVTPRRQDDPEENVPPPGFSRRGTRALEVAENLVYGGIALFLVLSAFVLLGVAGKTSLGLLSDFSEKPVLEVLDILLLVFIVVELLFAVRTTVEKRELVAEPFLLVGIIASIKEIVVLSVEAAAVLGSGAEFDDRILEIGLLGGLVVLLGVTSYLLRRKEREPDEGEPAPGRLSVG